MCPRIGGTVSSESGQMTQAFVVKHHIFISSVLIIIDVLDQVEEGGQHFNVEVGLDATSLFGGLGVKVRKNIVSEGVATEANLAAAVVDHPGGVNDEEVVVVLGDAVVTAVDRVQVPFVI